MHYYDYKYSNNNLFILSFDIKKSNDVHKYFLHVNIFSQDGNPIDNANIRIIEKDLFKNYILKIDAHGFYPYQTNIQLKAGYVNKTDIKLTPVQLKNIKFSNNQLYKVKLNNDLNNETDAREMSLILGMEAPKGSLLYIYADKFDQELKRLSNGKIKLNIITDKKMGSDRQMLSSLLNDEIQFMISNTSSQVDFIPKISIFDLPLVYSDINKIRNTIDNKEFNYKISNAYKEKGYKLLGIADSMFRQITSNKEIKNAEDFEGIKIRVYQSKNFEEFWKALNTTIVPLPVTEIYNSLRHGYIDSQTNPYENIVILKLYELQKYLIITNHMPYLISMITSDKFYNNLNLNEKSIIDEAAFNATKYTMEKAVERVEQSKKFLTECGMTIIDLPDETIEEMRKMSKPAYDRIINIVNDGDLVNAYLNGA